MRAVLLLAGILSAAPLHAAHPLMTEDAGTQGAGRWQLEGTSDREKHAGVAGREDNSAIVLTRGIAENLDAILTVPWYRAGKDGIGDLGLDLKWRFFERGPLSFGLKPGVTAPTGDDGKGRGTGRETFGAQFIASWEPEGPLALHAHAGFRQNRNKQGERDALTHFSAAATYRVGDVRLVVDVARDTNPDPAASGGERYLVLGAMWSVRKDFDLDAGVKTGHGSATLDNALLFGATVRW